MAISTDRIIFMGTPQFAVPTLEALINTFPSQVVGVITRPDTPKGRHKKPTPPPIKEIGIFQNIPVEQPLNKSELEETVFKLKPTLIIVIAYGMIIPKTITDTFICINVHGSILPKYRGASPIQAAILNGDHETGLTLIHMNEKMDEGDILHIVKTTLSKSTTFGELEPALSQLSATTVKKFLLEHPSTKGIPQDHNKASYCKKIQKSDLQLSLNSNKETLLRSIKAFSPKPGAFIIQNDKRFKIIDAEIKDGTLVPTKIQPEGKPIMSYHDYCLGSNERINFAN